MSHIKNMIKYNGNLFNIKNNLRKDCETKVYSLTDVDEDSASYDEILDMIDDDEFEIHCIERINNPFLMRAYQLKKEQKRYLYGTVDEELYFHGTEEENIDNICRFNFNWRLNGTHVGHKFGKGVSFSPSARYAAYYCDEDNDEKVMVIAKVLIVKSCIGKKNMILPPPGFDTTQKPNGNVVVKYEDNEFLPEYLVYFSLDD